MNSIKALAKWNKLLWPGLAVIVGLLFFFAAMLPVHQPEANLVAYGGLEPTPEGFSFLWAKPGTSFGFNDVPRFAPVYVTVRMSLDRLEGVPPAHVELVDREGDTDKVVGTYDYSPDRTGFKDYIVKFAPAEISSDRLEVIVNSNGFKVPGDSRDLGVRIENVKLRLSPAGLLNGLLFPRPYLLAVLLLLLGMAVWNTLLGFSPLINSGLLATTGFACGVLANILAYQSFVLVIIALLLLACAGWWAYGSRRVASGSTRRDLRPVALFGAMALFSACFVLVPGLPGDIYYWRQVLEPIIQYGPIGVYPHAPRLVYPPGSVYFLWGYGLLTQPFGIAYNQSGLKALLGSAHFGLLSLLWYIGYRSKVPLLERSRALALFGFSLSLVFVPVSWVQADGWLTLLMIAPLALVVWGKPYASAGVQAVGILYKSQSWLLLPLYALTYFWRNGWRRTLLGGALTLGLVAFFGGLGFAFDVNVFKTFWSQPVVSGESAWGGIRSFNLLHALDFDQKTVPQPLLTISYASVGLSYLAILFVMWRRNRQFEQESDKLRRDRLCLSDWLLASGLFFMVVFYLWVKMHERYLYFGLAFLPFVALWRKDMYRPTIIFNFIFMLNLLYAYLPERRDPVPPNFMLWRHALHADWFQNVLVFAGLLAAAWLAWLYFKPLQKPSRETTVQAEMPDTVKAG